MNTLGRLIIGILFTLLFFIFVFLSTLNFQILNKDYLLPMFERHQFYERIPNLLAQSIPNDPNIPKEERDDYSRLVKAIPPSILKMTVERNLREILNYIHGNSTDVIIFFPGLIPGASEDMSFRLSQVPQASRFSMLNGIGQILLLIYAIVIILILILYLFYTRLTDSKKIVSGAPLLIACGILTVLISLILKLFFHQMTRKLPQVPEPSQQLLGLFASTVFAEITTTWMILGSVAGILGVAMFLYRRIYKKIA